MLLSVMGIYNAYPDIFDNMLLPTQLEPLRSEIIDDIMIQTAELEVIYPDNEVLKYTIGTWSKLRLNAWQKIANAMYHEYDPFVNFTRDETRLHTETRNLHGTEDITDNGTETYNNIKDRRDFDNTQTRDLDDNTTNKITAFDSNTLATVSRQDGEDNGTINNAGYDENVKSGNKANDLTRDRDTSDTGTIEHAETFHSQGDSALYTPTDIAGKEFEMRANHDIIELIEMEFKTRFCIMVY